MYNIISTRFCACKIQQKQFYLGDFKMKRTGKFAKILSIMLCAVMLMIMLASCGKSGAAFTFTIDGKEYTVTESEYEFMMMYRKYQIFSSNNYYSWYDELIWDDETNSAMTEIMQNTAKTIAVEKYLMEKFGLEHDAEELKELKQEYKTAVTNYGGKGAFKKAFGWTADQMYEYDIAVKNNTAIQDYLYNEETGVEKVTAEELETYYQENFYQYLIIMIDTTQDIARDKDGNKKYLAYDKDGKEVAVTDISEEYLKENEYTLAYSYEYEEITDEERKENKALLAEEILAKLKEGEDFQKLALEYSDEFLTEYFERGYIVEGDLMSDEDAKAAIDALKVGDYTETAISLESGKYLYLIKRVELEEKAYEDANEDAEDKEYADIFADYYSTVASSKYEKFLEEYVNAVVINSDIVDKYTMADVTLSPMIASTIG